eukprot:366433-Chlamydomonas_euryale.AAC.21
MRRVAKRQRAGSSLRYGVARVAHHAAGAARLPKHERSAAPVSGGAAGAPRVRGCRCRSGRSGADAASTVQRPGRVSVAAHHHGRRSRAAHSASLCCGRGRGHGVASPVDRRWVLRSAAAGRFPAGKPALPLQGHHKPRAFSQSIPPAARVPEQQPAVCAGLAAAGAARPAVAAAAVAVVTARRSGGNVRDAQLRRDADAGRNCAHKASAAAATVPQGC